MATKTIRLSVKQLPAAYRWLARHTLPTLVVEMVKGQAESAMKFLPTVTPIRTGALRANWMVGAGPGLAALASLQPEQEARVVNDLSYAVFPLLPRRRGPSGRMMGSRQFPKGVDVALSRHMLTATPRVFAAAAVKAVRGFRVR